MQNASMSQPRTKRLLVWDTFKCHFTDRVKSALQQSNTHTVPVPPGCTKLVQPADISWNAPFKAHYRDLYTAWMSGQDHERTKAGYLRAPSKALMVNWIVSAWESVTTDTICRSFDVRGVTSYNPKVIHCTKEGGVANGAHVRLQCLMSQPDDLSDEEDGGGEDDDIWSTAQGSEEDVEDVVGCSEDEIVHDQDTH